MIFDDFHDEVQALNSTYVATPSLQLYGGGADSGDVVPADMDL